ncbi:MAG: phosphatase PAP2 family protein [Solirubrobacteraceae bacterium]
MVAGAAAPPLRRRLRLSRAAALSSAAIAPAALTVAMPRGRARNLGVCVMQMLAYLEAYKMPYDDPGAAAARVHVRYPVTVDRALGFGVVPSARLQRAFSRRGQVNRVERALVWCHWAWFVVPHGSVVYVALRKPERLPSAAARMYAVFDLGAVVYWAVPTAPPWWAASAGQLSGEEGQIVRRMMIEYGQQFWGERWNALYGALGGNPLAAMPSLHFATSLMAARLLSDMGPVSGAIGWAYASALGLALVYLGEHYAIDLIAGAALEEAVSAAAPRVAPAARLIARGLAALQARAAIG